MKKAVLHPLLLLTIIFTAFLIGVFCGRTSDHQFLSGSASQNTGITYVTQQPPENTSAFTNGKLNINHAAVEDIMLLPGIGEVLAQRIVDYRNTNGPFTTINELMNVKGIGLSGLEKISSYITVGG